MPEVNFEIIRLEDIGKDILKPSTTKRPAQRQTHKLSEVDIDNLTHYLHRYHQPLPNKKSNFEVVSGDSSTNRHYHSQNYINITNEFYSDLKKPIEQSSKPLAEISRYHHHHHRHHHHHHQQQQQQQQHTRHTPESFVKTIPSNDYQALALEIATCGMKKNTRLPVPHENFSLISGCFGDDAGFTTQSNEQNFLGISDGAGGNLMYGYDPRLFSESLMRNCSNLAQTGKYPINEPKRLLCHAFDRVQNENCFGSATACVVGIDCHNGQLHSVNIGDSGYVIVRNGRVIYRSRSQKMNGDCPRQLDVYPWTASLKTKGLNYTQISSADAICQNFQLELDDIVILSTDGLFDNIPDQLIERILLKHVSIKQAANHLVNHAVRFYIKPDDILVIMARVTTTNDSSLKQK